MIGILVFSFFVAYYAVSFGIVIYLCDSEDLKGCCPCRRTF